MFFNTNKEYQIGRGEVAESRVEAPFFVALMLVCGLLLICAHLYWRNPEVTLALSFTMTVFAITALRVSFGVYVLVLGMLLSPEITAGAVGSKDHALNMRYNDVLILAIFMGVFVHVAWKGRMRFWIPSPINSGILVYFGICILSTLLALRRGLPYFDEITAFFVLVKMVEYYLIFFLVGNAVSSKATMRRLLILFFMTALFVAIYGIGQVGKTDRVGTPFESEGAEPNTLGGYLMLVMILSLSLYRYAPSRSKKALFLLLFAIVFAPFLFTLSRASYLALVAAMIAMGIKSRSYLVLSIVGIGLLISPFVMPSAVQDRVNYTFQKGAGEEVTVAGKDTGIQVDKSTYERIYVWKKVGYNLRYLPWYGGGVSWDTVMDSQYARVLIETGLFGFAAFLFMQFRILRTTHQTYKWADDWVGRSLGLATFSFTIGLIVHSFGTISFLIVRIMEPYWFLVAMAVVVRDRAIRDYVRSKMRQRSEAPKTAAQPSPLPQPVFQPAPVLSLRNPDYVE